MKLLALFLLIVAVLAHDNANDPGWGPFGEVCLAGKPMFYDPSQADKVPWFTINLDEDPMTRWKEVAQISTQKIKNTLSTVRIALDLVDPAIYPMLVSMCAGAVHSVTQPYQDEIKGFAQYSNIEVGEIALMNMFYEISKGCTSVVAETKDGKIYHGRNQDFGTGFGWNIVAPVKDWYQTIYLKDQLINVNYMRGGQLAYKGVTFAGHMGVLTGLKPHAFTLSTNARFGNTKHNMIDFFKNGVTGRQFLMYADRDVLEKTNNYADALNFLSTEPLLAAGYFILGGRLSGEGAIITRGPNGTDHIQTLDKTKSDGWYVLETNYDWDKTPIYLDIRQQTGVDCMNKMGQDSVGLAGMYQLLSSKPNLNKATVYTAVMQVDDLTLQSFIRDCEDPCWFV